jgi:diguanylate cyclase (GGDEF)-like protein
LDWPPFASHLLFPLRTSDQYLGSLSVYSRVSRALTEQVEEHLGLLADEFTAVARVLTLYQENRRLSISDGLTGLFNFRYFLARLEEAFQAHKRYERPCSVVLVDADRFKMVNDEHGHIVGDEMLRHVATLLRNGARSADVVARYGGDEFVILMPETGAPSAAKAAERIRANIESSPLSTPAGQLGVTASLGVSEFSSRCSESSAVLAEADSALYQSKRAGRNAVSLFDEDGGHPEGGP